jgi:hypothetical protein
MALVLKTRGGNVRGFESYTLRQKGVSMYLSSENKKLLEDLAQDMWDGKITLGAAASVILRTLNPSKVSKEGIEWAKERLEKIKSAKVA